MFDKLADIEARYDELERLMGEYATDYEKVTEYAQERVTMEDIVNAYRAYTAQQEELEGAREMAREDDSELRAMAEEEITRLEASIEKLAQKMKTLLLPKDLRDDKNVIVEIRAGAGGDEAGIFAADLFRMYARYAEARNWKVEIIEEHETGVGGYKSIIFEIRGRGAFNRLKYESGVHRVQRVPATESQGRIHTSTATVAVLAEMEPVDVKLDVHKDIRTDFFRSSGAGGQNVQKNSTAVRLFHIPTGMIVEVQDERSQLQNRERAMQVLVARLYDIEMEKMRSEREAERRDQVGSGDRSEKIRTYNYPQNRVTDHRINYSNYNLARVMEGDFDDFVDQLATTEQAEKLSKEGL